MNFLAVIESQISPGSGVYSRSAKNSAFTAVYRGCHLSINRRYTKGVPFPSKMVCKKIRGERLAHPLRITLC